MTEKLIDIWDVETFDNSLLAKLSTNSDIVRYYMATEKDNLLEYMAADRWRPLKSNSYAPAYQDFVEQVILPAMADRIIRAWHYTRLTDAEVDLLRAEGIYLSTLDTIRMRLNMQIAKGFLSAPRADALYGASAFHQQDGARANKFWMTSHPQPIDSSGIIPLLEHWGGEGVYFWLEDIDLIELVKCIGRPRVIEIAVPLEATNSAYAAAKAVVATFAQTLDCAPDDTAFDLCSMRALGPESVLHIHTDGDPNFAVLGCGYPTSFIPPIDN